MKYAKNSTRSVLTATAKKMAKMNYRNLPFFRLLHFRVTLFSDVHHRRLHIFLVRNFRGMCGARTAPTKMVGIYPRPKYSHGKFFAMEKYSGDNFRQRSPSENISTAKKGKLRYVVDRMHFKRHIDPLCGSICNPDKLPAMEKVLMGQKHP